MRRSVVYPWTYVESLVGGWTSRSLFAQLQCFVLFIGQPRGGNSLVGSLLNAHRNLCLAQELGALRFVARGYGRSQLLWLIYRLDRAGGRRGYSDHDYRYAVPGQWQGCFESLWAMGDVKAGATTERLGRSPDLVSRLEELVRVPVRLVHVVRNPFPVIAAIQHARPELPMATVIDRYFHRCAINHRIMKDPQNQVVSVRWETFLGSPRESLTELCRHFGLSVDPSYLDACQLVLNEQTREFAPRIPWDSASIDRIYREMENYSFLSGYQFDGRQRPMKTAA